MNGALLSSAHQTLQLKQPLVLNITNYVAMGFTANALLALGASPIMAHAEEELADLVPHVGALVLNIGTLDSRWVEAMQTALSYAKKAGIPVVLDPVGVHATPYRLAVAEDLLKAGGITVIRGNAAEVMALGHVAAKGQGVDSTEDTKQALSAAEFCLAQYGAEVVISGPVDRVVTNTGTWCLSRGNPMMTKVTAMGCAASALVGAFLAVSTSREVALCAAMGAMSIAGEAASEKAQGPGSFAVHFLDALYTLKSDDLAKLEWL